MNKVIYESEEDKLFEINEKAAFNIIIDEKFIRNGLITLITNETNLMQFVKLNEAISVIKLNVLNRFKNYNV